MTTLKLSEDELVHVVDLLLATANADGRYEGSEADIILDILESLVEEDLPVRIRERLKTFSAESFDLAATCAALDFDQTQRDALFGLISKVIEADMVVDFDESEFLKAVAGHLGAASAEIDAHLVKFIELSPPPIR